MQKTATLFVVAFLLGASLAPGVKAGEGDQKTLLTFSEPVELPGIVLPAGSYIFKVMKSPFDRSIVQVLSPDQAKVYATINAIPKFRRNTSEKTSIIYADREAGEPRAIKEWYFPNHSYGHEFVYPSTRPPLALARTESVDSVTAAGFSEQPCPEMEQTTTSDESTYLQLLQRRQSGASDPDVEYVEQFALPEGTSYTELLQQKQTEPRELARSEYSSDPPAASEELPRTASLLPFAGFLGIALLTAGLGVRLLSRSK